MTRIQRKPELEKHSSPGDDSKSVTPKDVSKQFAAAKDITERNLQSADPEKKQ